MHVVARSLVVATVLLSVLAVAPARVHASGSPVVPRALLVLQQAQLTASEGHTLGASVAVSGDTVVVGAPQDSVGDVYRQGTAYVFVRRGETWTQQAQLIAADGEPLDFFGWSVAVSGDTVVIGAREDSVGPNHWQGSAYVFVRSGENWTQEAKLTAADGAASDSFGWSVAASGETVVVGAPYDDVGARNWQGSAYVFVRSDETWMQQTKLTAADGAAGDEFGHSVALSGDTAVIGAWFDHVGVGGSMGSAYVFARSGEGWDQQAQLTASGGAGGVAFGTSVAVSAGTAVVGAFADTIGATSSQGSAYVFARSGEDWSREAHLIASDGAVRDFFGQSVAVRGDVVAVGAADHDVDAVADQGAAYVFARDGGTWSQQAQLTAGTSSSLGAQFGASVAVDGATVVAGCPLDTVDGHRAQGSAYVYTVVTSPGVPVAISPGGRTTSRRPTYRWTAVAGATAYEVLLYRGGRLLRTKRGITETHWKVQRDLPRRMDLTWKVRAVNSAGAGSWSPGLTFRVVP